MKRFGHKIAKIVAVDEERFRIKLAFADGFQGIVDLQHLFGKPKGLAAEVLRGAMFSHCRVEAGALAWANGLELCPDALRRQMEARAKDAA
jgi:hypothetical protein